MKADGYNAVTVYFDWDYTSPSPGVYDFTGVRDMNLFLNMAQQAGLYVIARPGPYINAETDGGGIPSWVLNAPNGYRTDTQPYLSAALQWFSEIDSIIAPHQISNGGSVILYQIENEYTGRSTADLQYLADLEQQAKADGIDVPFTFNQCCGGPFYTSGTGAVNISGPDNYPLGFNCADPSSFGQPYGYPVQSGEPLYLPEFQGGSFDGWGGSGYDNCYNLTGPDFENVYYKNNIAQGVTMQSNYMGVGGTNWGWLPDPGVYTSYDYGAAIRETGEIGTPANPNSIVGLQIRREQADQRLRDVGRPADQYSAGGRAGRGQPGGDHAGPGQPVRRHPVHLRPAGRRDVHRHGQHAPRAEHRPGRGLHLRRRRPGADLHRQSWTHANTSNSNYTAGDYDSTESWSTQAGAAMSVTFTGTAVQWIGPKNTNGGIADVSIDGTQVATVDTYAAAGKEFQQVLFSQTGLSAGSHTLTITVSGNQNPASSADTVVIDAINVPTAAEQADYYPTVPQSGTLTLDGRDSRLLLANYDFGGGEQLVYSTSELMTQGDIGGQATAVLYDPDGTDGETVLRYTSQPVVSVLSGTVQTTWDASRGDLRLDYTHHGLAEVQITEGGAPPLRLLIASTDVAEELWPESTESTETNGPAMCWSRAATWSAPPRSAAARWR